MKYVPMIYRQPDFGKFIGVMEDGSWGVFHRPSPKVYGGDLHAAMKAFDRMVKGYGIEYWLIPDPVTERNTLTPAR